MTGQPRAATFRGPFGLGPRLTGLLLADVVLVVMFLILLATPPGTSPSLVPESVSEPETTPEATAPQDPLTNTMLAQFVLPSGNIWCDMTATSATCTIEQFSYQRPEAPPGCAGTVGNQLRISADAPADFPCVVGDPPLPAADLPVLEYGQASTVGEMTCHSSRNGATCRHEPSGEGFSVARAGYTIF